MDSLELILHPVRLRIIHAMAGGRSRTTSELCESLPDIAKATMYRHVGLLADEGLLEIVAEARVHGAVERTYRLQPGSAIIDRGTAASMTEDDHRRAFAAAMASLVAEFNTYLDRSDAVPVRDSVSYLQIPLWLNKAERAELVGEVHKAFAGKGANRPARGRSLYLFSPILFPLEQEPGTQS